MASENLGYTYSQHPREEAGRAIRQRGRAQESVIRIPRQGQEKEGADRRDALRQAIRPDSANLGAGLGRPSPCLTMSGLNPLIVLTSS